MASSRTEFERVMVYGKETKSRSSYIKDIADKLCDSPEYFPTAEQERFYQETLGHVVRVFPGKRRPMLNPNVERGGQVDKRRTREHRMIEIMNKLRSMERRRLYEPPLNDEIGYYRLIKKYMVSMALFFDSYYHISVRFDIRGKLVCFSPFRTPHYMEEIVEINRHLSDISDYTKNGCGGGYDLKSLLDMAIGDKVEAPEILGGNQKRSNKFYGHKFNLALMDLHCSHHSKSPPNPDEKKCYEQVLNLIPTPQIKCEQVNPFLDDGLLDQFEERILDDIRIFDKHFTCIAKDITEKLSFPASWETIVKHCDKKRLEESEGKSSIFGKRKRKNPEDEDIEKFQRELLDRCKILSEDLPNYIEDVARSLQLMNYIDISIKALSYLRINAAGLIGNTDLDSENIWLERLGWEALHALTLIDHGSFDMVNEFPQKLKEIIIRINNPEILKGGILEEVTNNSVEMLEEEEAAGRNNNNAETSKEEEAARNNNNNNNNNNNVEMLKEILEEVGEIQNWHSEDLPSEAEMQVIHKICHYVVSSTHFFTCTLAFEQMTHILHHHRVDADKRASMRNRDDLFCMKFPPGFHSHSSNEGNFIFILRGFMDGLQERFNMLRINKLNGAAVFFDIW